MAHRNRRCLFRCRRRRHHIRPTSQSPPRRRPDQISRRRREHDPTKQDVELLHLGPSHPSATRNRRKPTQTDRDPNPLAPRRPRRPPPTNGRLGRGPLEAHQLPSHKKGRRQTHPPQPPTHRPPDVSRRQGSKPRLSRKARSPKRSGSPTLALSLPT